MATTNPVGCSVETITRFFCGQCGNTSEQSIIGVGYPIWQPPQVPDGWHQIDDVVFCDRHKVKIEDV